MPTTKKTKGKPEARGSEMSKREVASFLSVSDKSLERYASQGRLVPIRYQKPATGGRMQPVFARADVEALRTALEAPPIPRPIKTEATTKPDAKGGSVALARQDANPDLLASLLAVVASKGSGGPVPLSDRLSLSLKEAGAVSGLPVSTLRAAAKDGSLFAPVVGRGRRVYRQELNRFVEALFKPKANRKTR